MLTSSQTIEMFLDYADVISDYADVISDYEMFLDYADVISDYADVISDYEVFLDALMFLDALAFLDDELFLDVQQAADLLQTSSRQLICFRCPAGQHAADQPSDVLQRFQTERFQTATISDCYDFRLLRFQTANDFRLQFQKSSLKLIQTSDFCLETSSSLIS